MSPLGGFELPFFFFFRGGGGVLPAGMGVPPLTDIFSLGPKWVFCLFSIKKERIGLIQ